MIFYFRASFYYEEGTTVGTKRKHAERALMLEWKFKLNVENERVPDPIGLNNGWIWEKLGMKF